MGKKAAVISLIQRLCFAFELSVFVRVWKESEKSLNESVRIVMLQFATDVFAFESNDGGLFTPKKILYQATKIQSFTVAASILQKCLTS